MLFGQRDQANQTTYCRDNGMKLLSIQDLNEEEKLYAAWGTCKYSYTTLLIAVIYFLFLI